MFCVTWPARGAGYLAAISVAYRRGVNSRTYRAWSGYVFHGVREERDSMHGHAVRRLSTEKTGLFRRFREVGTLYCR